MGTFPKVPPYLLLFFNKNEIEWHLGERPHLLKLLRPDPDIHLLAAF